MTLATSEITAVMEQLTKAIPNLRYQSKKAWDELQRLHESAICGSEVEAFELATAAAKVLVFDGELLRTRAQLHQLAHFLAVVSVPAV